MLIKQINTFVRISKRYNSKYYVTTPIFYVNAAPHIGHLYSAVIADAICRYQRLLQPSGTDSVRLCTGTDEHGTKIQQAAAMHKVPVAKYCDKISSCYKDVFGQAGIAYTDFIRTTEQRHREAVSHFWRTLNARGYIYSAQYSGWYCISDETFLTDSQLRLDETTGTRYSLDSGHPVEWTEETNYMFRLRSLQDEVTHWVKQSGRIRPLKFQKILLDILSEPLPDVSVSRPINRVHWAIPVPDDEKQTIYVWLDALINYLTSAGYPDDKFRQFWPPKQQVIGKDILKFHGIYWPAFLIAAGLEPPQQLFVHSHWTVDGQKMSKSKNNVIDPMEASKVFTMEGLRYFLLREGVPHSDGNYSNTKALRILNSELADTLGNLLSRVCAKTLNPSQIYPQWDMEHLSDILKMDAAARLKDSLLRLQGLCTQHYEDNNFYLVVDTVMSTLHAANNFFENARPWELKSSSSSSSTTTKVNNIGSGDGNFSTATTAGVADKRENIKNAKRLETIIAMTMDTLRVCCIALQPIVPQLSGKLLDKLNIPQEQRLWRNLNQHFAATITKTTANALQNADGTELKYQQVAQLHPLSTSSAVLFRRILLKNDDDDVDDGPVAVTTEDVGNNLKQKVKESKVADKRKQKPITIKTTTTATTTATTSSSASSAPETTEIKAKN